MFGLDPGEPPISAILIIIAVISAAAAMQAAGGIDYMVMIASKALRARPKALNFVAPYVSYVLTILTGTGNTFFSIIPVINEVAYANKIRPERALAGSTVASAAGITSSPVAAATATLLPLVEIFNYDLVDVLLITIPSSLIGIFAMSVVMSRYGKELDDDPEYQRRLAAGEIKPPAPPADIVLQPYAKRSVAIFLRGRARDLRLRLRREHPSDGRGRGRRRRADVRHAADPDDHAGGRGADPAASPTSARAPSRTRRSSSRAWSR